MNFDTNSMVQLTLVRFREFWREPEAVFWTFVFPLLMAGGLGVAFRDSAPDVLKVGVVDSREIAANIARHKGLAPEVFTAPAGAQALRTGAIALLVVPQDGGVAYRFDNTNPDGRTARLLVDDALQRAAGRPDPLQASEDLVREPGSRYIDFLLPGLLGMNLMGNGIWGLGFAIVDARRKKLLKRLVAAPMSRTEYLLSFLFSRLLLLVLELVVVLGFGTMVFGVPMRGNFAELLLICLLASFAFGGLGLLIASRARTIEAVSGIMNFIMLPMWIVCGVFFSARRFPDLVQPVIRALPLTATIDALRANMLEGAPLAAISGKLVILAAWSVICFAAALKIFRWR